MIDFHSHTLPGIDDGSKNSEESIALLRMLAEQGVDTVVATPHYNANRVKPEEFVERRRSAYARLRDKLSQEKADGTVPKLLLGAEVEYYDGISRLSGLESLCIEGSSILLLEMPTTKWSEYTRREVLQLSSSGITLMLAHVERFMFAQSKKTCEDLLENGILMQTNADFFTDFFTRKKAFGMLKNNFIHVLGSDCHGVSYRPPHIGKAYALIEKKMGSNFVNNMIDYGESLLSRSV